MAETLPRVLAVRRQDDGVELDLRVEAELACFAGHFPDLPILPGVVQLDWAVHFARAQGIMELPSTRAFQVKFRSVIRPHDVLVLALRRVTGKKQLKFEYRRGAVVCSSGQFFTGDA